VLVTNINRVLGPLFLELLPQHFAYLALHLVIQVILYLLQLTFKSFDLNDKALLAIRHLHKLEIQILDKASIYGDIMVEDVLFGVVVRESIALFGNHSNIELINYYK